MKFRHMESVSKNMVIVGTITTLEALMNQARLRNAIWSSRWRMKPAAFIVNMPFCMVASEIESGNIYFIANKKIFK